MALSAFSIFLIVAYVVIVLGIGFWSSRRQKEEDFLIAGRKLGTGSFIATVVASYIGGGAIVAYTAYVYQFGISAIWVYVGTAIGFLAFIWYALRIRREGRKGGFHTISDWLRAKVDNKVAVMAAILILVGYFGFLVNQFIAGSVILSGISGLSYELALLFSGTVILIYLVLGGFRSVVRTDIFQYLIFVLLLVVIVIALFGENPVVTPELLEFGNLGLTLSIAFIVYGIFTVMVGTEYWQRVYAAKSDKVVKHGLIGSAVCILIIGAALSVLGLVAASVAPGLNPNSAAVYALNNILPTGLLGLGLILVFAAIMSSADTIIFVLSLSVAKDYFGRRFFKGMNQATLMKWTRTLVVLFSVLGVIFAFFFRDIIQVLLTVAGVVLAGAPVMIASFHMKIKPWAGFFSLLSGLVYVTILVLTGNLIPELAAASIVVAFVVLMFFQLILKR